MSGPADIGMIVNPFAQSEGSLEARGQNVQSFETIDDPLIAHYLKEYDRLYLDVEIPYEYFADAEIMYREPLRPNQIDLVLQMIITTHHPSRVMHADTGIFISSLIRHSFKAGNNDFCIRTGDTPIRYFPYMLSGTSDNKLRYEVFGHVEKGNYIDHCIGIHHGDIIVGTELDEWYHSDITLHGFVSENCFYRASCCRFRTDVKDTFDKMMGLIQRYRENVLQLIDAQGNVLKEEHR